MNSWTNINDLNHGEILAWLKRALEGQVPLPRLTPDESPYLGILRLEKELKAPARDSLRDGCLALVRRFCADGCGETTYLQELLSLAAAFKLPEAVSLLAQLAVQFAQWPNISIEIRQAVLAMLVDTPPPQPASFWEGILKQNPEKYAALALSGMVAINPEQAIKMLPQMPDTKWMGEAAALKLDLAWDNLLAKDRFKFTRRVQDILMHCGSNIAGPVKVWVNSKTQTSSINMEKLRKALQNILGEDSAPKWSSPKLCYA